MTSTAPVRFGVVGCGRFGLRHLACLAEVPGATVTAVYDIVGRRAEEAAARAGTVPARDVDDLLRRVDAVCVVVPPESLAEVAAVSLAGERHVLLEKPCGVDAVEVEGLVRTAEERGLVLQPGFVERFHPALALATELVPEPGRITATRTSERPLPPGGAVLDLMVHDIDHAARLRPHDRPTVLQATDLDGMWTATIALGAARAVMTAGRGTHERQLILEDGARRVDVDLLAGVVRHGRRTVDVAIGNPLVRELTMFAAAVRGSAPAPVPALAAVTALRTALDVAAACDPTAAMAAP